MRSAVRRRKFLQFQKGILSIFKVEHAMLREYKEVSMLPSRKIRTKSL